jgi:hypothetical protein
LLNASGPGSFVVFSAFSFEILKVFSCSGLISSARLNDSTASVGLYCSGKAKSTFFGVASFFRSDVQLDFQWRLLLVEGSVTDFPVDKAWCWDCRPSNQTNNH